MWNIIKAVKLGFTFGYAKQQRLLWLQNVINEKKEQKLYWDSLLHSASLPAEQKIVEDMSQDLLFEIEKLQAEIDMIRKAIEGQYKEIDFDAIHRIDYRDILGQPAYTRGDNLTYFSPLRDDGRHPSFSVNTKDGVWYDFVLGEGGDIIKLYMMINNTTFKEAIKALNQIAT